MILSTIAAPVTITKVKVSIKFLGALAPIIPIVSFASNVGQLGSVLLKIAFSKNSSIDLDPTKYCVDYDAAKYQNLRFETLTHL